MKLFSRLFAGAAILTQLVACGGGGGAGASSTGSTGSTGGTTATPTITIALTDKGTGEAVTSISPTAPAIASVTVKDATGAVVSSAIVTFTVADSSLATLTPTSGTALTNSSGVASIQVNAASI